MQRTPHVIGGFFSALIIASTFTWAARAEVPSAVVDGRTASPEWLAGPIFPSGAVDLDESFHFDAAPPAAGREPLRTSRRADAAEVRAERRPSIDEATSSAPSAELAEKVNRVLTRFHARPLNTGQHSPWEVMHYIVAFGVNTEVRQAMGEGETVNAIAWLSANRPARGERLLEARGEHLTARSGGGLQGHPAQFLAILAQSRVPADYPLQADGRTFTVADLVETEKRTCRRGEELTFKLIALMHYLDSDAEWRDETGQEWSLPRLIREEIASPIRGATCGGTHRLTAMSYAVAKRRQRGEPIDGEYQRAQTYMDDYRRYAFSLQNSDGSFSTEWFAGRGDRRDADRRLQTTGHILEWLVLSLPEDQLHDERVVRAVDYLAGLLDDPSPRSWSIGPLGHALHGLAIYQRRALPAIGAPSEIASRRGEAR